MPRVTRWFVRLSFLYLVGALIIGLGLAARRLGWGPTIVARFSPVYFHFFMLGWATQLIFGVAHWMFPNYSPEAPRGREALVWTTLVTVNVGLLLRAIAEPLLGRGPVWGWLLVFAALLQWVGILTFVWNSWPRVRPRR